mgnify:CR=1 FL=1
MLSALVKSIMEACNLHQKDLAEVIGASLSRVKSITSGRVKNLKHEEIQALVTKLGINPTWLTTQQGPMFSHEIEDETDAEFENRILRINYIRELLGALPIEPSQRERLAAVMTGDPVEDAKVIVSAVESAERQGFHSTSVRTRAARPDENLPWFIRATDALSNNRGERGAGIKKQFVIFEQGFGKTLAVQESLLSEHPETCATDRESELLRNYRNSPAIGKEAIEKTAKALAVATEQIVQEK